MTEIDWVSLKEPQMTQMAQIDWVSLPTADDADDWARSSPGRIVRRRQSIYLGIAMTQAINVICATCGPGI
jgi:hypothetical protein